MHGLLEAVGFIDIEPNANGTYNATRNGERFHGLYIKDINMPDSEAIDVEKITFTCEKIFPDKPRLELLA